MEDATERTITLPKTLFVDDFTIQLMLIGLVYLVTYGFLNLAEWAFAPLDSFAKNTFGSLLGIQLPVRHTFRTACEKDIDQA